MTTEKWRLTVPFTKIERCLTAFEDDFLDLVKRVGHLLKEIQDLEDDHAIDEYLSDSASEGLSNFLCSLDTIANMKEFTWDDWKEGKSGFNKFIRAAKKSKKVELSDGPVNEGY